MEENKKKPTLSATIVKFFRSRATKGIIASFLLVLAVVMMFLMDSDNVFRGTYFAGIEENFVKVMFEFFGIKEFNIKMGSWAIFTAVYILAFVFLIGNIWTKNFVSYNLSKFEEDARTKGKERLYKFLWFVILFVIAAAIAFGVIMFLNAKVGGIELGEINLELFLNLLYSLLICLAIMLIIPLTLFIIYFIVIRGIFWIAGLIVYFISGFYKDIKDGSSRSDEKFFDGGDIVINNLGGGNGVGSGSKVDGKDMLFALARIDEEYAEFKQEPVAPDISLEEFILQFQSYAINNHKIYYELPILRAFVAGMSSSRLIILEGLSGTGKSMLPRMFSEFTGCRSFFAPVQATWRDKSDMLGYYSEFTKVFKVTDFLKNLYTASYYNDMNMMVLDEMNLSRIEYYFADFLSILEYPKEDWLVKLIEPEIGQVLPAKLEGGYVRIPANTWFIGTANTDDSTFTITDKVYDRAFVIDFKERFAPIASDYNSDQCPIDSNALEAMFEAAKADEANQMTTADLEKFLKICDFVRDRFDIRFGNRIMVQINNFVPVYVAMGGKKEEALDLMFARKILRKLNGMYDDYIKDSLIEFKSVLNSVYGKGAFVETEKFIDKIIKRLG